SSESNDFGDLFCLGGYGILPGGALVSSAPTKQSFIRRVWHPAIPTLPPMVRDSNFVVYLYDILFISLFFIVIIYAFMV
ncbi:hypothetical protein, partial [Leyella stercorea]|uniref:hypothetical protein n=1 Tax=Leyella stercorea TaxID=363265 RepID=UPI004025D896